MVNHGPFFLKLVPFETRICQTRDWTAFKGLRAVPRADISRGAWWDQLNRKNRFIRISSVPVSTVTVSDADERS